jgi:cell division transport system permease protein
MGEDLWLQGVAITTLAVALAIVGAYLTLCLNLREAGRRITTGGALMVVMTDAASREDGLELARQIAALPEAAEARFVDRAQALTRFRQQLGPHADLLDGLEDNPLPNAVELFLAPGRSPDEALLARLKELPQVGEVVTGRPWLSGLERTARSLGEAAWALGGVLFLGVVLLVMNTVRLAIYVRRDQLEILDLVGAKPAYARWPFVLEAVIQASLASALASALIWGLMQLLKTPGELPLGLDLEVLLAFPWGVPLALMLLAQLAGVLGGLLGVGRALRPKGLA